MVFVAFGISSLVLSMVAIFIPVFGVFITGLSGILAWCSVGRAMYLGLAAVIVNILNIFLFSSAFLQLQAIEAFQRTSEQSQLFRYWILVLAVQLIALFVYVLDGLFDFCVRKGFFKGLFRTNESSSREPQEIEPIKTSKSLNRSYSDSLLESIRPTAPSRLTRVVVKNIYKGRKGEDSFWKSEDVNPSSDDFLVKKRKRVFSNPLIIIFPIFLVILVGWGGYNYYKSGFSYVPLNRVYDNLDKVEQFQNLELNQPPKNDDVDSKKENQVRHRNSSPVKVNHNQSIYSHVGKDGKKYYSNTVPSQTKLSTKKTMAPIIYGHSMPVKIYNNKVYVTASVGNNGKTIETSLEINPNIQQTRLPERLTKYLNIEEGTGSKVFINSNGRGLILESKEVDFLEVGPIKENDVRFLEEKDLGASKRGILGRDFLGKHPYSIDYEKKIIIWSNV